MREVFNKLNWEKHIKALPICITSSCCLYYKNKHA